MKLLKIKDTLTVVLDDGSILTANPCNDELYNKIFALQEDEDAVKELLTPNLKKAEDEVAKVKELMSNMSESTYLTVFGDSVYLKHISELTLPQEIAIAIHEAEQAGDEELLQTYFNFWTLCSLNPDSRVRTNLFWFLKKYGMTISKSGLFVAYRNVKLKEEGKGIKTDLANFVSNEYIRVKTKLKKSPTKYFVGTKTDKEGNEFLASSPNESVLTNVQGKLSNLYFKLSDEEVAPIYTDSHSGTFTIKIGEPVTMPREDCDAVQENTCSRGLHVAGRSWLDSGYFGNISLVVLVNPADVVAVPPSDNYGKMRTCSYFPIQLINRDEEGNIIDNEIPDGFEDEFVDKITYTGEVNNEDDGQYMLTVPNIPEVNREKIMRNLDRIREQLKKKES